jgi:hypothetical protein
VAQTSEQDLVTPGLDEHLLSTRASGIRRFHSEMRTFGFGSEESLAQGRVLRSRQEDRHASDLLHADVLHEHVGFDLHNTGA